MVGFRALLAGLVLLWPMQVHAGTEFQVKNCLKDPVNLYAFNADDTFRLVGASGAPSVGFRQVADLHCATDDGCRVRFERPGPQGGYTFSHAVKKNVCLKWYGEGHVGHHELTARESILCDPPYC